MSQDPEVDSDEDEHGGSSMSRRPPNILKEGEPYGHFSMAQCIDLFKSLSEDTEEGSERSAIRKCSGVEVFDNFEDQGIQQLMDSSLPVENDQMQQSDPMITEEMTGSMSQNLKEIYKSIVSIRGLISSGSVVKAWLQVSGLVKLTERICGMGIRRRNSQYDLNANEVEIRRRIWWLVLDLEVQISTLIGQPLNVSKRLLADMERPMLDELDESSKRLQSSKLDFREAALELLSKIPDDTQAVVESGDYNFLAEHLNMERFEQMQAKLPHAQPGTGGASKEYVTAVMGHRIEFLAFKMLLSCVLAVTSLKDDHGSTTNKGGEVGKDGLVTNGNESNSGVRQGNSHVKDITSCARKILDEFETWYQTQEVHGTKNWTTCLYAFSAAAILTIAVLRKGVCHDGHFHAISKVHTIFSSMAQQSPSSIMVNKVCTRIGALVGELKKLKLQTQARARKIKIEKQPAMGVKLDRVEEEKSPRTAEPSRKRRNSIFEAATDPEAKRKKMEGEFYPGGPTTGAEEKYGRRGSQPALFQRGGWPQGEHEAQVAANMQPYFQQGFGGPVSATFEEASPRGYWYDARWNEANAYPAGWWYPPLARPMPPFQLVDEVPYANQFAGMGEDMSFGYSHDGPGRRFQHSAGPYGSQSSEQAGLTELAPGWHEPLQGTMHAQSMASEAGFENAGPGGARAQQLSRQHSAAAYGDNTMAAQATYHTQGGNVFSQGMAQQQGMNPWSEAEDPSYLGYATMNFIQNLSQEPSNRPQVSRSWSGHAPSGAIIYGMKTMDDDYVFCGQHILWQVGQLCFLESRRMEQIDTWYVGRVFMRERAAAAKETSFAMYPPFDYFEHSRTCTIKQRKRDARFAALPDAYKAPLSSQQRAILDAPIASLVGDVQSGKLSPVDILRTYGKTTVLAHQRTNCATELLLPEAESWAKQGVDLQGPLAGIPVSLKDTVGVAGFDASVGYSRYCFKPWQEDGAMVKLLKRAGAVPHVKTACPITLLSFESTNAVWGVAKNPHNPKYSPGGSTGGESALLALNGSRIGIGSDVAGSVRTPAAWAGIYSLRCSTGRWPKTGFSTSMPGQEGIPSVYSPMARTLDDLTYFTRALIGMKAWEVDYSVHPIPWREHDLSAATSRPLRVGYIKSDDVVPPSPAIARGLDLTASALRAAGHQVVDISTASFPADATPAYGLQIASLLLCADGGKTFKSFFRTGETNDPGAAQIYFYMSLPRPIKYLWYLWTRYVKRDPLWAGILRYFHPMTALEQWKWVAKREAFRSTWFEWWNKPENDFDFILTAANATPALPHGAMHDAVSSCGYTFLFNLLDYSAGVIPVTKVDPAQDALPADFKATNGIMKGAYKHYDAQKMAGLPCAVQIVGRRLTEEKTLGCMAVVEEALRKQGTVYEHLDPENLPEEVWGDDWKRTGPSEPVQPGKIW
ncbi:hypothetical protein DV737_g5014, partial [Chaetothyriales sp. CBS 132003]